MDSYGFADGDGNEITRGYQATYEQARAFAQRTANEMHNTVDMWIEGDTNEDGEPVESLETFEPEWGW